MRIKKAKRFKGNIPHLEIRLNFRKPAEKMNKITRQLFAFFLFTCLCHGVLGQTYIPESHLYGLKDGLSHRQVNDILEDKRGFIWVATPSGLNRFDGYIFRIFGREDGLLSDQIEHIFEDAYGLIWVFYPKSIGAIEIIDPLSNKVFSFNEKYGKSLPNGFKDKIGKPILTKDSTLYWADAKGFITFHPKRGYQSVVMKALGDSAIFTINFVSNRKTVWGIIGNNRLVEVGLDGQILQEMRHEKYGISFVNPAKSTEGIVNYYSLLGSDDHPEKCVRVSPNNKTDIIPVADMLPNLAFKVSSASYEKLFDGKLIFSDFRLFDTEKQTLLHDFKDMYPELKRTPKLVVIDSFEKIWVGTDFGLLLIDIHKNRFKRLLFQADATKKGSSTRGILEKGQELFINTEGGIFWGDKKTGNFQKYPAFFQKASNPLGTFWYALSSDKFTNIFAGSEFGLSDLTPDATSKHEELSRNIFVPWTIFPDTQQRLWIGTFKDGLSIYNRATKQLDTFDKYNGFEELKSAGIIHIQADRSGQIWLCATTGFYKLDFEKGILERHWMGGKGVLYLPHNNIYHFYEDKEGVFWLASGGGGLIKWDKKTGQTKQFSRKAGLPNNTIYAVYEDKHEHLWLPSDYGIIQFDKNRGQVRRIYLTEDGITHPEFNRISHYRGADSTLYFGGLNGVTAFNPNDFYATEVATNLPLVITNFQQFDGNSNQLKDKTGDLLAKNEIILHPDDRFFNLEFALLSFNQIDKIQYAYKIDGIDADWNYQNEPRLRISRLTYGTHTLHIRGQAANGLWGSNELTIKVSVLRPFYLQFWFIALILAVILGAIWYIFKWRTQDLQKNQERLEKEVTRQTEKIQGQTEELRQLDSSKTRLYTNITHEFRTPLTVIMGMADNISGHETERTLIQRNSNNLLRLINQLLDLSKLDSGTLKLNNVHADIIQYLQYLTESFYSMAKEKNINLTFYAETKELVMDFDENKIQHIIYNLLSNAIKFTNNGGKVIMHALQIEQERQFFLKLKVQDTGVGIDEKERAFIFDRFYQADSSNMNKSGGTGIGLALTKELIERMEGTIELDSNLGQGTSFTILLPVKHEMEVKTRAFNRYELVKLEKIPTEVEENIIQTIATQDEEKPLLLIIEDNHDVVFYMKTILQDSYDIRVARHGQEGIDMAFDCVPDIIISDVMMPEKTGYEVCQTLKMDERTSHIPIILLTAKSTVEDKIAGLKVGADAYLMKPFHKEELFVRLEKLLELRQALQKHNTAFETTPPSVKTINLEKKEPSLDDIFLQKIRQAIEKGMGDTQLGILQLCRAVNLSHTQVFRKLKAITGENPTLYIRKMRLQKALTLLKTTELNISEIAYETGFSDPNYFSRAFNEEFGVTPSAMRK